MSRSVGTFRVTGIVDPKRYRGLQRVLQTMKPAARTRFVRRAIRAAFQPAFLMMRRGAPKRTGLLRRSIKTTIFYSRATGGYVARLGPGFRGPEGSRARHAHLVELGTRGGTYETKAGSGPFTYPSGRGLVRTDSIRRAPTRGVGFVAKTKAAHEEKINQRITKELDKAVLAAWKGAPKT